MGLPSGPGGPRYKSNCLDRRPEGHLGRGSTHTIARSSEIGKPGCQITGVTVRLRTGGVGYPSAWCSSHGDGGRGEGRPERARLRRVHRRRRHEEDGQDAAENLPPHRRPVNRGIDRRLVNSSGLLDLDAKQEAPKCFPQPPLRQHSQERSSLSRVGHQFRSRSKVTVRNTAIWARVREDSGQKRRTPQPPVIPS